MNDLIERLEKAAGADEDLDEAIACLIAPPHARTLADPKGSEK